MAKRRRRSSRLLGLLVRDRVGLVGGILVVAAIGAAVFGPVLAPYDPTLIHPGANLAPPGPMFPLGADELGRDILSRALYGARISMEVSLIVVTLAGTIGVTLGLLSGYFKGLLDVVLMRLMDTIFAFPTLLLALTVVAVYLSWDSSVMMGMIPVALLSTLDAKK